MAKLKKESLVDQSYRQLREEIVTGALPLGSHLNVNELQEHLGVSCTPIREAMNRLQQEGLVLYENNVGARVLTLDAHDVREIQELALTLQTAAVRLAMKNGDREAMAREIQAQIHRYNAAQDREEEVGAVHDLVGIFYHHCGNRRLDKSMVAIQGQQLLLRYLYCACPGHRKDDREFRQMLQGVREGDGEAVCRALEDNARRAQPQILAALGQG